MTKHMLRTYFFRNIDQMSDLVGKLFRMRRILGRSRRDYSIKDVQVAVVYSTKLVCYRKEANEVGSTFSERHRFKLH